MLFKKCEGDAKFKLFAAIELLCIVALFFAEKSDTFKSVGACFGFAVGALVERKFINFDPKVGKVWQKVLRCALGLALVAGLKAGLKPVFALIADNMFLDFLRYMIIVFVAIALYPMLFKKIKL